MSLLAFIETAVPVVAFLLMLAVGLDVTAGDLARVSARRRLAGIATLAQLAVLPAAALLIVWIVPLSPANAEYLLLLAACPGGGMSNVYVYLARANTALSVTLTALSCIVAVASMPLVLTAYSAVSGPRIDVSPPMAALLAQLLVMAVIPVTLGAWARHRWPALERRYGGLLRQSTALGVVAIVAAGLVQARGELMRVAAEGGPAALLLVAAGMAAGWLVAAAAHADRADRFTLLTEFAVRNLAITMVIEVTLLGNPGFIAFGAVALFAQAAVLMTAARIYTGSAR